METKSKITIVTGSLLLALLVGAPTATAHNCTAEEGGPSASDCWKPCKPGEDHQHMITHRHPDGSRHVHYFCHSSDGSCWTLMVLGRCIIDMAVGAQVPGLEVLA